MSYKAFSLTQILAAARSLLAEPVPTRRYTDAELIVFLNLVNDDLGLLAEFEKELITFTGLEYQAILGEDPRYYLIEEDDFMRIDTNWGIVVNGIHRTPTTKNEQRSFQERAISNNSTGTLTVNDYFTLSYTGLVAYCSVDYEIKDPRLPNGGGKLLWFVPNIADDDVVELMSIRIPEQFVDGGTIVSSMIRPLQSALINGTVYWALKKAFYGGYVAENVVTHAGLEWDKSSSKVVAFYTAAKKNAGGPTVIKTAAQVLGIYNTAGR